jgi:hypothetical protein
MIRGIMVNAGARQHLTPVENTECSTQPADRSLINRRLPTHLRNHIFTA